MPRLGNLDLYPTPPLWRLWWKPPKNLKCSVNIIAYSWLIRFFLSLGKHMVEDIFSEAPFHLLAWFFKIYLFKYSGIWVDMWYIIWYVSQLVEPWVWNFLIIVMYIRHKYLCIWLPVPLDNKNLIILWESS